MHQLREYLLSLFGPDAQPASLTIPQICARGVLIFVVGLVMVRLGDRRSLANRSAFDTLLIVLLGSMLSRAINGTGALLNTIAAAAAFVAVHRLFAYAAMRWHFVGKLVKGEAVLLVRDGRRDLQTMTGCMISEHDLDEDMRLQASTEDVSQIAAARLERSGQISFIKQRELAR
jgi:uncharacterized membrane protein YcaP (DUF421 family)